MTSFRYDRSKSLKLFSRNEGKIKSFESCFDVRAWSHDFGTRDRYLRDWIKCDTPVCIIPSRTLVHILRRMTLSSVGKVLPKCHPRCKSKLVIDSICASCHAMRECFRTEEKFVKYFQDEELETSDWPCEKCLDALKSIKMFWRIIIDKLFNGKVVKKEKGSDCEPNYCMNNVMSVTKIWQKDMMKQASYVKNVIPLLKNKYERTDDCSCKVTDTRDLSFIIHKTPVMHSKHTSVQWLTADVECECTPSDKNTHIAKELDVGCLCKQSDKNIQFKSGTDITKEKNESQREIEKLKREIDSLRLELKNVYHNFGGKCRTQPQIVNKNNKNHFQLRFDENKYNAIDPIASEMIITVQNCKDESYRHISLLQVLHKTNTPDKNDLNCDKQCCKKEDPMELLTKVQNKFGDIVNREKCLAAEKSSCSTTLNIDAKYHKVDTCNSDHSWSKTTVSSFDSRTDAREYMCNEYFGKKFLCTSALLDSVSD